MVVTSRCFACRTLIFENVFELRTRQVYVLYRFPRRLKLEKTLPKGFVNFVFAHADIIYEKNQYFGKHLFAKEEVITRTRLRDQ